MNNDSHADAQEVSDKQKAWNAQYYDFLNVYQRGTVQSGEIFTEWCDDIAEYIRTGQIATSLNSIALLKEQLGDNFRDEAKMIQKHHEYLDHTITCYQKMVEVMRDYSQAGGLDHLARGAEIQLDGIKDFWLAPIANLDPERV